MNGTSSSPLLSLVNPWGIVMNLWRHRDLVWQFTLREIHARHKGSQLGVLWTLINPLSMLALYGFVFGVLFASKSKTETSYDFILSLFLGLSLFRVISETLGTAPSLIVANQNFVKKVVFPLEILPVAKVGDAAFHLVVSLALVVVGSAFSTAGLSWNLLWLPVLVLPLLLLTLGVAWVLAALGVFLRDIHQAIGVLITALMFASAVPFPAATIQTAPKIWAVLKFNPLLQIIDLTRSALLWHQPMAWTHLAYVYTCALGVLLAGHFFFSRLRPSFAEVI